YLFTILVGQRICHGIEAQISGDRNSGYHFWRSNKCIRIRITISTFRKVTVERVYNGIFLLFVCSGTVPHADTWTTCIGKDRRVKILESFQQTVTISGIAYLLRTWVDTKFCFSLQSLLY